MPACGLSCNRGCCNHSHSREEEEEEEGGITGNNPSALLCGRQTSSYDIFIALRKKLAVSSSDFHATLGALGSGVLRVPEKNQKNPKIRKPLLKRTNPRSGEPRDETTPRPSPKQAILFEVHFQKDLARFKR
jgi:hypothetical protein